MLPRLRSKVPNASARKFIPVENKKYIVAIFNIPDENKNIIGENNLLHCGVPTFSPKPPDNLSAIGWDVRCESFLVSEQESTREGEKSSILWYFSLFLPKVLSGREKRRNFAVLLRMGFRGVAFGILFLLNAHSEQSDCGEKHRVAFLQFNDIVRKY